MGQLDFSLLSWPTCLAARLELTPATLPLLLILAAFAAIIKRVLGLGGTRTNVAHAAAPPRPPVTNRILRIHDGLPLYDAAFNLRLSYLYGPAIELHLGILHPLYWLACFLPLRTLLRLPSPACAPTWRKHDTTLLLNSEAGAHHILGRLGAHYSSRPPSIAAGKHLSDQRRIVLHPYTPVWRAHHRALVSALSRDRLRNTCDPVMQYEAGEMVCRVADILSQNSGTDMSTASRDAKASPLATAAVLLEPSRFTASSVLQIAYARRAQTPEDAVLRDLEDVSSGIAHAFEPGRFLVERWPILDRLPACFAPWKRELLRCHRAEYAIYSSLVSDVEHRLVKDSLPPVVDDNEGQENLLQSPIKPLSLAGGSILPPSSSSTATLLASRSKLGLSRKDVAYIAATIFEAGTETTASTITAFLLAMACYPAVAERATREIDALLSASSAAPVTAEDEDEGIPNLDMLEDGAFFHATIRETLRFTPTGSSGVVHTSSREGWDELGGELGFGVPGGVSVLPNIYGIHRTPSSSPFSAKGEKPARSLWHFDPERHLRSPDDARIRGSDLTPRTHAFGFGRRKCPGSVLASHSLLLSCSFLLAGFTVSLAPSHTSILHRVKEEERRAAEEFARRYPAVRVNEGWREERRAKSEWTGGEALVDAYTNGLLKREDLDSVLQFEVRNEQAVERIRRWVERKREEASDAPLREDGGT